MSKFNLENFYKFCATVTIATKERGKIKMSKENMLGSQIYFLEEVAKGINEGIHEFYILKGRQVAVTTATLLLDMYWLGKHDGLTGAFVTHDEGTRDMFRTTFDQIADSTHAPFKISFDINNRTQMVTSRGDNRLLYMVAGTRKNSKLGKGSALTFAHLTECSEYGDAEGLASLKAAFAQENENRLFIFESTAEGFNHWYESWLVAKHSNTKRAIFVGWWRNNYYKKLKGSKEYEVYWDGKLTPDERNWVREIKQIYDYDITDEQIAWYRWNLAEETKDELLMHQNYPATEHQAFVKSGSQFFSGARINDEFKLAIQTKPANYRFVLKDGFEDTELIESSERMQNLKVWELPQPGGYYAIGADPAWGSSEWKDRFVCLDDQTELLTDDGWKKWNEITKEQKAVCFDLKTEQYSYQEIQHIVIRKYKGDMHHFTGKGLDYMATPEHRVVLRTEDSRKKGVLYPWKFLKAEKSPKRFYVPKGGAPIGRGIEGLDLDSCRIMGWIATDGCRDKRPENKGILNRKWTGGIVIVQSKNTTKNGINISHEMEKVLTRFGGVSKGNRSGYTTIKIADRNETYHMEAVTWRFGSRSGAAQRMLRWFEDDIHRIPRRIINNASKEQLESIYIGLLEGDGTSAGGVWTVFYPGHCEGLADDFQEIAMRLGHSTTKLFNKITSQWNVRITRRKYHCTLNKNPKKKYDGTVWDITVPTGAFVARRNGKVFVSGNCQVYRCWSDGMEQVAEFCTPDCSAYQFAWVICYLGGAYLTQKGSHVMLNLELNGPGMAVWQEILNLKRMSAIARTDAGLKILKIVSNLQNYTFRRQDSFGNATGFHTISNTREKERMMTLFRDGFERKSIKVNSRDCLDEMRRVERDEGIIGAPDRQKDDRVLGSALATTAYVDFLLPRLMAARPGGLSRAVAKADGDNAGKWQPTMIQTFLRDHMNAPNGTTRH